MAVAAHVSRVAKDYTPFGYSIMESAVGDSTTAVGSGGGGAPLALFDDAPAWVESVYIMSPDGYVSGTDDGANNWEVSFAAIDASGGMTLIASWSSWDGAAGVDLTSLIRQEVGIVQREIPSGTTLLCQVSENGVPNADLSITIFVRYRRKA
jgi:hypothetical protein